MTKRQLLEQLLKLNADVNSTIAGIVSEAGPYANVVKDAKAIEAKYKGFNPVTGKWDPAPAPANYVKDEIAAVRASNDRRAEAMNIKNGGGAFGGGAPMRNPVVTKGPFDKSLVDYATPSREPDPTLAAGRNFAAASKGASVPAADGPGTAPRSSSAPGRSDAPTPTVNPNMPTSKAQITYDQVKAQVETLAKNARNMTADAYAKAEANIKAQYADFASDPKDKLTRELAAIRQNATTFGDAALTAGANAGERIESGARRGVAAAGRGVETAKQNIGSKIKRAGESIEARGLGGAIANQARKQGKNFTDNARQAAENPREWAERNPGNAATAGLAGAAAIGGSIYAASQMAKRRRWSAEGCDGIKNPEEKTRCKNYLKSKK